MFSPEADRVPAFTEPIFLIVIVKSDGFALPPLTTSVTWTLPNPVAACAVLERIAKTLKNAIANTPTTTATFRTDALTIAYSIQIYV